MKARGRTPTAYEWCVSLSVSAAWSGHDPAVGRMHRDGASGSIVVRGEDGTAYRFRLGYYVYGEVGAADVKSHLLIRV